MLEFDYFNANENEQYLFLQIPLMLIKDEHFKKLSDGAKILYSLLLNRTSLSARNGWKDAEGRVYIIYTTEEIMEDLNCWKEKATKTMKELKEIGLIKSVRQGMGKPNMIYVMNFATALKYQPTTPVNTMKFENRTSRSSDIEPQEVRKSNPININYNNTYSSNIKSSQSCQQEANGQTELEAYTKLIKNNIRYNDLLLTHPDDMELIHEFIQIILDTLLSQSRTVRINSEDKPRELVKSNLMKLTYNDIIHVLEQFKSLTGQVKKKRQYILTMLYNSKMELEAHYTNLVNQRR